MSDYSPTDHEEPTWTLGETGVMLGRRHGEAGGDLKNGKDLQGRKKGLKGMTINRL